jgi:carboxyl-terminal processing protease
MRGRFPLPVLGLAAAALVGASVAVVGADIDVGPERVHASAGVERVAGHDLRSLSLLRTVLFHIEESYVDGSRIDHERMARAGLEAVERRVPSVMFRRVEDGTLLHVEIGEHRSVLEVPPIVDALSLEAHLAAVAEEIDAHLDLGDVPLDAPGDDPLAEIEYAMVNGILGTLDPHSILLAPAASQQMDVENDGEFGGLGVTLSESAGRLHIVGVERGGPAEIMELQQGDVILRIEGVSTLNMTMRQAVELLRGAIGAPIRLDIKRGDRDPFEVVVVRDTIALNPVEHELLDGAVGYIRIETFHKRVGADVVEALAMLTREANGSLGGVVLDLRGNPGGYMQQAIAVADAFLWAGTIVSTVDADNTPLDQDVARAKAEPRYPMVVLVDGSSASASEIVAGALRNNGRAVIMGARTFGKGSVQNLYDLTDGSKLKLTVSKYLTPNDQSIQGVGIPADIELVATTPPTDGVSELGLFASERVTREADLDTHLDQAERDIEEPAFRLRYHREADAPSPGDEEWSPRTDREVIIARDLLLGAPSWRRAEALAGAAVVVERWYAKEQAAIEKAFSARGVDWRPGALPPGPLDVSVAPAGGDTLLAGAPGQELVVTVTNRGATPASRIVAVLGSTNALIDGREAVFGYVRPGESKTVAVPVDVPPGWPDEAPAVKVSVRDASEGEVAVHSVTVPVTGSPAPRLAWSWSVEDRGDADGLVDLGDTLTLAVTVENVGAGPTAAAEAVLRSYAGRAVDLQAGRFAVGAPAPGGGGVLAPGASASGEMSWVVTEAPADGRLDLTLELADDRAYDHGGIDVAHLYEYFQLEDPVTLTVGAPLPQGVRRSPPNVQITRAPDVLVTEPRGVLSGVVDDDLGIQHVMVWNGEDKVFYQGSVRGGAVRTVPFTADLELVPGANVVSVVAIDSSGLATVRSLIVRYDGDGLQARAGQ